MVKTPWSPKIQPDIPGKRSGDGDSNGVPNRKIRVSNTDTSHRIVRVRKPAAVLVDQRLAVAAAVVYVAEGLGWAAHTARRNVQSLRRHTAPTPQPAHDAVHAIKHR